MKIRELLQRVLATPFGKQFPFWGHWALRVLFVWPSVTFCAVLVLASGFSFATIPRDAYKLLASESQLPAAPEGFLTVRTCKDIPLRIEGSSPPPPPVVCKNFGYEQRSIEELAQEAGESMSSLYLYTVLYCFGVAWVTGSFKRSRKAFTASLAKG